MASQELSRQEELARRLHEVRMLIDAHLHAHGRTAGTCRLLPVTKFHPVSDIEILQELGCREVAENREQEARQKAAALPGVAFHMIGQIQTKKANSVARWARSVHSVDSTKLAGALNRGVELAIERGDREPGVLDCCVQLSIDGDTSRGGVALEEADSVAASLADAQHLRLNGVMCVPPRNSDARNAFEVAARLRERWETAYERKLEFSAGMSGDMEEAIAAGSTIVRVGTAILGSRPIV